MPPACHPSIRWVVHPLRRPFVRADLSEAMVRARHSFKDEGGSAGDVAATDPPKPQPESAADEHPFEMTASTGGSEPTTSREAAL